MPKKKEEPAVPVEGAVETQLGDSMEQELGESPAASEEPPVKKKRAPAKKKTAKPKEPEAEAPPSPPAEDTPGEIPEEETPLYIDRPTDNKEETLRAMLDWRAIRIGAKNGRVCTGSFTGLERISDTSEVAVADYKGCRVLIPLEEMISQREFRSLDGDFFKLRRRITQMLGAEVEFALMGVDEEAHTIVGSRRKAMEKRIEEYYLGEEPHRITKDRIVEARIVAVGRLSVRVEVFGVETTISGLNLSWGWSSDLREKYKIADRVFVRVKSIYGDNPENLEIVCEGRSVTPNPDEENLARCRRQSKYLGTVVNLRNSAILVRLSNGVNGIATGCVAEKLPAAGDEVCFLVTTIHRDEGLVRGLITRVVRKAH